jgi:predicted DNA-binding transcriptional regulator YafY
MKKIIMAIDTHLQRLLHIIRTVRRRQPVKLSGLQESLKDNGFDFSRNTVKRDINEIRKLGFSLEYDDKHRTGYSLEDNGNYTAYIENFLDTFELYIALESVKGFSDFVYPELRRPRKSEHLQPLIDAIKESRFVEFLYRKHSNRNADFRITDPHIFESLGGDDESMRMVAPYVLKEFRGLWYLIGKDAKDGRIKTFGFDRISDIKISDREFKKDDGFDIEKRYRDCFGIYTPDENSEAEEVILSFDAENGRYLKANPLHHSQKILVDTAEEFRIGLHLHITLDFVQEILTRTWSLRVIWPESLRSTICEIYKKAADRNRE